MTLKDLDIITTSYYYHLHHIPIIINIFQICFNTQEDSQPQFGEQNPQNLMLNCTFKTHPNSDLKGK